MPFELGNTAPLLVNLSSDHAGLLAGLVYQLPADFACYLIANRKAIPVADLNAFADVTLTEQELADAGLTWEASEVS